MDNIKDTQTVVATMKETAKTMKQQFEEINVDDVDDLYDWRHKIRSDVCFAFFETQCARASTQVLVCGF